MATETRMWPDVAIPPGEVLGETLEARGMSQTELARRMGRPIQAVNEIVQGTKEITAETALQLERVLGTPAHLWTRLQADYRYIKAKVAERKLLATASGRAWLNLWDVSTWQKTRTIEDLPHTWEVARVFFVSERALLLVGDNGVGHWVDLVARPPAPAPRRK